MSSPDPDPKSQADQGFWPETQLTFLCQIQSSDPGVRVKAAGRLYEMYRKPVLSRIRATWPLLSEEDIEDR